MPKKKVKNKVGVYEESAIHLCYDCYRPVDGSCPIYESITATIEEYMDQTKIMFQVTECENFIPDESDSDEDFEDFT